MGGRDPNDIVCSEGPLALLNEFDAAVSKWTRGNGHAGSAEVPPFETFDGGDWEGVTIEPRQWLVHDRIPRGEPGILSGDGGTGKTKLMQQLGLAVAAKLPDWIGGVVETHGPVLMFSAEEKLKEMHRRMADVLAHRKLSFACLKGQFHLICDPEDPVLGKTDSNGVLKPTRSLLRLEKTVALVRPVLVIIENAADVYAGNENDRFNVTRFVRCLLGNLTRPSDATVVLLQHPSVSGLTDGTGRSGTTAWNNAGRWRNHFTVLNAREGDPDFGMRQYEVVKNNYGPTGEKVRVRWSRGVFVPEGSVPTSDRVAAESAVDDKFLKCLDVKTAQQINVGPNSGKNYAPALFEKMPEAGGYKAKAFERSMERLLSASCIVTSKVGSPSKQRTILTRPRSP